ncbi:MAG TPA: sigma-70 family RNA polymerase sigma factor [Phycisphaerae bacterium]|nr:sigma-70 family RNA polymerase sigma factor [Phycisphaerae bacterium]
MLRFQGGETAAFEELVRRNTSKIHALVYRFLGDPGVVEDLSQEVFLRVYRTAPRYQPTAKFSTWLYRIVANLSFNVLRDRRKGRRVQLDVPGSDDPEALYRNVPDDHGPRPHHDMDAHELEQKVAQAISALPGNQKIAIILNKYESKSYEDIAAILGCSTMAVKSLLSRARGNLRESLSRYLRTE